LELREAEDFELRSALGLGLGCAHANAVAPLKVTTAIDLLKLKKLNPIP
jgi:hypothetical protein